MTRAGTPHFSLLRIDLAFYSQSVTTGKAGGCRDGFCSSGYQSGGAFTMALCNVWANGAFAGNWMQLLDQTKSLFPSGQIPQYNEYGSKTYYN